MLLGIDRLLSDCSELIRGQRIGLVSNQAGVNGALIPTWRVLHGAPHVDLRALFGPEHGFMGEVQDALHVASGRHRPTGLLIYSLYQGDGHFGGTAPPSEILKELDALVIDLQDVGVRFYTYISTMVQVFQSAAQTGLRVVVLDRPNPITGGRVDGNILQDGFQSFLGIGPIPWCHGLTIGELAPLLCQLLNIRCRVEVVPMRGWRRHMWFDETGLQWVPPSPNIPTLDTAIVYPGTCLVEGTNVSEGRGTTRPFEMLGAPWIDGVRLADALNAYDMDGCRFRPVTFLPVFDKYAGEVCEGVHIHVTNRATFYPVAVGIVLLHTLRSLYEDEFKWRHDPGDERAFIDWLAGTDTLRKDMDAGRSPEEILVNLRETLTGFHERAREHYLYS